MTLNKLKLNSDKTEFLVFNAKHRPVPISLSSIMAGNDHIESSASAKNIGVIFDNFLLLDKQVTHICKAAFSHIRNIAKIRKYISFDHCEILIHAFVTSRLDYCNSMLSGLPKKQITRLQYVQNSAARLLTGTKKYDSISPVLMDLHWLPVAERIDYKIMLLTFKAIHGLAPAYLSELLTFYKPKRTLRSANKSFLDVPRCNLKMYGQRAFSYVAPTLWNRLSYDMRTCETITEFKSKLKTFLFKRVFS